MSKELILNQKQINSVVGAAFFPDPVFQACTQVADNLITQSNNKPETPKLFHFRARSLGEPQAVIMAFSRDEAITQVKEQLKLFCIDKYVHVDEACQSIDSGEYEIIELGVGKAVFVGDIHW